MRTTVIRTVLSAAFGAALLIGAPGTALAAPAAPAEFCAALASPASDGVADPLEVACAGTATAARAEVGVAAAGTLLMTYYADAGWKGSSLSVYGNYGHCDEEGYDPFDLTDAWEAKISSIRGYQTCNAVIMISAGRSGVRQRIEHNLSWSFGATTWNDDTSSVKVYCNRSC